MVKVTRLLLALMLSITASTTALSQMPGLIVRPAGGQGKTPLNPNGDQYSSKTDEGFKDNDIAESEVPFKVVPAAIRELSGDLRRGAAGSFSDIVTSADGSGFYVFNDGENLMFRLRMGGIVAGSKGYSVLIDTDNKFGATGAQPDPNFLEGTDGSNGNPGFELEIVFETNSRVAIYDIDGSTTPTLIASYNTDTHSQISVALSRDSDDPDFFYDFYVPIDELGLTATTPLRMASTSVMTAGSAIRHGLSDIYGVDDKITRNGWEAVINSQPPFTLEQLTAGGSGIAAACTQAPVLHSPIRPGEFLSLSGSWNFLDTSKPQVALIYLFKNDELIADIVTTTGTVWSIGGINVEDGDVFYAKAESMGESICLPSSSVRARNCQGENSTSSEGLTISCIDRKGMRGSRPRNAAIRLYRMASNSQILVADDNSTMYRVTYTSDSTWEYHGQHTSPGNPCSGGPNDIANGNYQVTAEVSGFCESEPVSACLNMPSSTIPVINERIVYSGTVTLSGRAANDAVVRLSQNGTVIATTTAINGRWSFPDIVAATGDKLSVVSQAANQCASSEAVRMVACYTSPPTISMTASRNIYAGGDISGMSQEAQGTEVFIYENNTIIGTALVNEDGSWTLSYPAVAGRDYYAIQKGAACDSSTRSTVARALQSANTCPVISGNYNEASQTVRGTLSPAFTGVVRLYLDDVLIGSQTLTSATNWSIPANTDHTNILYAGGELTATAQATGMAENRRCSNARTIACTSPPRPNLDEDTVVISIGQAALIPVRGTRNGILYSLLDDEQSEDFSISTLGNGNRITLQSNVFQEQGTFGLVVKAISFSGQSCQSTNDVTIHVFSVLPVNLLQLDAKRDGKHIKIDWKVSEESALAHYTIEKSADGKHFKAVGIVKAANSGAYTYIDEEAGANKLHYRLMMTDKDGTERYSRIVQLAAQPVSGVILAPNPFKDRFTLSLESAVAGMSDLYLFDAMGKLVRQQRHYLAEGLNTITMNSLQSLSPGIYFIRLRQGDRDVWQQKVVK